MRNRIYQAPLLSLDLRPHCWSVRFSGNTADGVREDGAVGLDTAVSVAGSHVVNGFDAVPIYQRTICNATWSEELGTWTDVVEKGAEGFSWSPTESHREVLYRCPPFWYRVEEEDIGLSFVSVADRALPGYELAPMFGGVARPVYRACFPISTDEDGVGHSRAFVPALEGYPDALMSAARAFSPRARTEGYADRFSDYLLQIVEFGTRNIRGRLTGVDSIVANTQTVTRNAYAELKSTNTVYAEKIKAGTSLRIIYRAGTTKKYEFVTKAVSVRKSGSTAYITLEDDITDSEYRGITSPRITYQQLTFPPGTILPLLGDETVGELKNTDRGFFPIAWRGRENPWGNQAAYIWDVMLHRVSDREATAYYLTDISKYTGTMNADFVLSDVTLPPSPSITGCITRLNADSNRPWMHFAAEVNSSSSNTGHYARYNLNSLTARNPDALVGMGGDAACGIASPLAMRGMLFQSSADTMCGYLVLDET